MKIGKIISVLLLLCIIGFVGYVIYTLIPRDPCQTVLHYSIGRFDTNFGISKQDFINSIQKAETVWEKPSGKELFSYDPNAKFTINLIYDERQRETLLKQRTESGLEKAESLFTQIDDSFNSLKNSYESKAALFKTEQNRYEARRAKYESEVDYWNKRGGAPQGEYSKLQKEADELNTEAQKLNTEASELNQLQDKVKAALTERNKAAQEYNKVVENFNSKYGHGYEFDQAEYTHQAINVYQFTSTSDLTLALAHEFGHALNMDHVQNSKSIMYFQTYEGDTVTLIPSKEDLTEFRRVCGAN